MFVKYCLRMADGKSLSYNLGSFSGKPNNQLQPNFRSGKISCGNTLLAVFAAELQSCVV